MVQWYNFIFNICCQYLLDHPVIMGRPSCTVEIDESKFMHRKYHHGHYHEGHWVLGMVEHETNVCMMVAVPDCITATLLPIIAQHVLPGMHIITDGWQAYNQLAQHDIINHQLHCVDPNDPTLHTNTIEGAWANIKAKFCVMHGMSDALFNTYLQEYLWHKICCNKVFGNILYWIWHYYPCSNAVLRTLKWPSLGPPPNSIKLLDKCALLN